MTRDAELYFLTYKDWKPLAEFIDNQKDYSLKHDISIYQLMTPTSTVQHYAILSLSNAVDKIVEDYGAELSAINDMVKITLKDNYVDPLYGDKIVVRFLKFDRKY